MHFERFASKQVFIKDRVKTIVRIFYAHSNRTRPLNFNCLKRSFVLFHYILSVRLKFQRSGPDIYFCYGQKI